MGTRTIVVNGRTWKYRVGRSFVVAKAQDSGECKRINVTTIIGWSSEDIERSLYKKGEWAVKPSHVAKWLSS